MKNWIKILFLLGILTFILYPVTLQNKTSSSFFKQATTGFIKEVEKSIINQTVPTPKVNQVTLENRERLIISSIQVNAAVESLGLTSNWEMATPKDADHVGWYNLGTPIGDIGSAVIAGHLDGNTGKAAVFFNLHKLKKGDKINYLDAHGKAITFLVREIRIYSMNADATDVFTSNDSGIHLNLITCTGSWNKYKKNYESRLVVFSDLYETKN